jgi:hypothetical protein
MGTQLRSARLPEESPYCTLAHGYVGSFYFGVEKIPYIFSIEVK